MNNLRHSATFTAEALLLKFRDSFPDITIQRKAERRDSVVVLGGNVSHTGALYRIAITALRSGACQVKTFCPPETAGPFASLAPDVSCTATLNVGDLDTAIALVVGPGLGQSQEAANCVAQALRTASKEGIPTVLDASSLFDLAHHASVKGALMEAPDSAPPALIVGDEPEIVKLRTAPALLGHLGCVQWSEVALVGVGEVRCSVTNRSSAKPLKNLQHVLAGVATVFSTWTHFTGLGGRQDERIACAAAAAVAVTRRAAELAFKRLRRSTMVSDVMDEIPQAVEELEHISADRNLSEQPTMRGGLPSCTETREGIQFHRFGSDKNHQESNAQNLHQSNCLGIPSLDSIRPVLPPANPDQGGFAKSQETFLGSSCRLANATTQPGLGKNQQIMNQQDTRESSQQNHFRTSSQGPARRPGAGEHNRQEISRNPASNSPGTFDHLQRGGANQLLRAGNRTADNQDQKNNSRAQFHVHLHPRY